MNEFDLIEPIVRNRDVIKLYQLKNNSVFSIALHEILVNLYESNKKQLNKYQFNLFLAIHLENSGQSCGVLGCLQEWFPQYLNKFVPALIDIDAVQSARAIRKVVSLLPEDGSWFFKSSSEESEELLAIYDKEFSDYPDGNMSNLYRSYATKYKSEIVKFNNSNSKN